MKVKPWQIAVIVVGLLVGLGSVLFQVFSSDAPDLPDSMLLIDVESGQLYRAKLDERGIILPAKRPDNGPIALLRVRQGDEGVYYVPGRDLSLLEYLDKGVEVKAIDPDSGDVLNHSSDVKAY